MWVRRASDLHSTFCQFLGHPILYEQGSNKKQQRLKTNALLCKEIAVYLTKWVALLFVIYPRPEGLRPELVIMCIIKAPGMAQTHGCATGNYDQKLQK